jgi:hypothetical protein
LALLRSGEPDLRRHGVAALFLFGSTARDEARPESDVDVFFDYDDPRFSLIELVRVADAIERLLGRPADVSTRDSLHPALRERIEASALRVF